MKEKWIPISEKLPEVAFKFRDFDDEDGFFEEYESDYYLVTLENDICFSVSIANYCEWRADNGKVVTGWTDAIYGERLNKKDKVVAWMPLPEPYKGE